MKKIVFQTKTLLLLTLTFISVSVFAGPNITLRLNLEKGKVIKYRSENAQVITQTMGAMNQVVDQSQVVDYTITVLDKEADGSMLVEIVYNRLAVEVTANGMSMKFDSDSEDQSAAKNPQFMGFAALVNKSIKARFSPMGEVIETIGVEEMLEQMLNEISGGSETTKAQMKSVLQSSFSSDAMKQMFSGSFIKFAEKSLKIGTNWTTNESIKNQFTLNVMNTYTLKDFTNSIASLDLTSTLTTIPDDKIIMQGMEMIFNLMGTQSGSISIDATTGIILESAVNQNITGNISADMGGQAMSIPMSITSQSKTSIIE